jgi:hypothetical protein
VPGNVDAALAVGFVSGHIIVMNMYGTVDEADDVKNDPAKKSVTLDCTCVAFCGVLF